MITSSPNNSVNFWFNIISPSFSWPYFECKSYMYIGELLLKTLTGLSYIIKKKNKGENLKFMTRNTLYLI